MKAIELGMGISSTVRVKILKFLSHQSTTSYPREVSIGIGVDEHLVAHHMKILENLGLVVSQRVGQRLYYGIVPDLLDKTISQLLTEGE